MTVVSRAPQAQCELDFSVPWFYVYPTTVVSTHVVSVALDMHILIELMTPS
jgi:hypothetical protein